MKNTILATLTGALCVGLILPAAAEISNRNIRVSNGVAADHPVGNGIAAMNTCMEERSDGKMKLTAFWSSALGDDLQATQALRSGTQEMVVTSTSPIVGIVPALGVFDLPFLFANDEEADAVLDGEFGQYISDMMPEANLINLSFWENGFRNLTNSRNPVEKWEDLDGMRVRVMQNNIFLDTFENMGANATPMAFGEVFTALETGAIDAQENPFVTIDTSKFYEVQEYLSVTRHAYTPFMVLFSKPIWDTYSEEEQAILQECAIVGRDEQRQASRELSDESLAKLKEVGLEVNELSEEEMTRMREHAQVVYERHAEDIGPEVVERMQQTLSELRGEN